MDAHTIATEIRKFIINLNIDENKCVGQGYDGCATMAGKVGGVQKILRESFIKKGLYFHCASHKLNLVINDMNSLPEIRNCVGTIKDVINFFRESPLRRKYAPSIPLLCETRWSQKYKSIYIFKEKFDDIIYGLEKLSVEGNTATIKIAFQLLAACSQTSFILALILIAKYNTFLEPIANILQSKSLDILKCSEHIKNVIKTAQVHRLDVDNESQKVINSASKICETHYFELRLPRIVGRQHHRANHPASSLKDYFVRSLYIPYLDFLINALESRFSDENSPAFKLSLLHPSKMKNVDVSELKQSMVEVEQFYHLENLDTEIELWKSYWKEKEDTDVDFVKLYEDRVLFYPNICKALEIHLALPTATIERSFSTLRRIKTWLRSTMIENRLNG